MIRKKQKMGWLSKTAGIFAAAQLRYLTKSRFQLSMECPTKLFYTRKDEYANKKLDDAFLLALAEGGFQVGELAKKYHPGGHDIRALGYEEAES